MSRISEPITPSGPAGSVVVPAGVDLLAMVRRTVAAPPITGKARIWVARGRANGLRRLGRTLGGRAHAGRDGDELELELRSVATLARWLAGHGPDVAVLFPPELADAVHRNWKAAAAAHAPGTAVGG